MALTIREATQGDSANIAALSIQVWLDTYATEGVRTALSIYILNEFTQESMQAMIADPDQCVFVAEMDGHLVGYIQAKLNFSTDLESAKPQAEVSRVYVQERFTRQGIGAALMSAMEKRLKDEGTALVWLTAWIGNDRARAFYPKIGYTDIGSAIWTEGVDTYENRVFSKVL